MKIRFYLLTLLSLICFTVQAQEPNMQQKIAEYLTINGTAAQYNDAYDAMFNVLEQQFAQANVPQKVWTDLKAEKGMNVSQVKILLASAYRKHFDEDQIDNMLTFYKTETGQKLAGDPTTLNQQENQEAAMFYGSPTGQYFREIQAKLSSDISQISEYWSRDLYKSTIDRLINMGYTPQY